MKIKLNTDLLGYKKGKVISFGDNETDIKLTAFWAKRIQDASIDGCIEIIEEKLERDNKESKKEEIQLVNKARKKSKIK